MDSELRKLFKKGEFLQLQMRTLFIQNKVEVGKIEHLPRKEYTKWKRLYQKSNSLTKEISLKIEKL